MTLDLSISLLGFFFTLAIFSYLLGDNPIFRFTLNVFIGAMVGYLLFVVYKMLLVPWVSQRFIFGNWSDRLLAIVPVTFALFVFARHADYFSRRIMRFSVVALAFVVGVGCAVALGGALSGTILPQAWGLLQAVDREMLWKESQRGLLPLAGYIGSAAMIVLGTLVTLLSFHYGSDIREKSSFAPNAMVFWVVRIGRFFVAAALGVIFSGVFQTGLTALIERVQFVIQLVRVQAWIR